MPSDWAPYSTGRWVYDPYYEWTWVDDAPWGWAPFHHGRWVLVGGFWAWAPGPVILRPVYAPALVAFFGIAPGVSVRVGIPGPALGWVGPRVVNNVVIERTTVVNVDKIVYQHTKQPRAFVVVPDGQFGAGPVKGKRLSPTGAHELQQIGDAHPARPGPASLVPRQGETIRAPAPAASRPVIATRPPREVPLPFKRAPAPKPAIAAPAARMVAPPKPADASVASPRPSFGAKGAERPRPSQPPRYEELRRSPPAPAQKAPAATAQRKGGEAREPQALPGRPANVRR